MRVSPATVSCGKSAGARHPRAVAAAVAATEQLIAAADGEQRGARRRRPRRCVAARGEVGCDERLLPILAAADVEEVVRARLERVARLDPRHRRARARAAAPAALSTAMLPRSA